MLLVLRLTCQLPSASAAARPLLLLLLMEVMVQLQLMPTQQQDKGLAARRTP